MGSPARTYSAVSPPKQRVELLRQTERVLAEELRELRRQLLQCSNAPNGTGKSRTASTSAGISSGSAGTYGALGWTMYRGGPGAVSSPVGATASSLSPPFSPVSATAAQRKSTTPIVAARGRLSACCRSGSARRAARSTSPFARVATPGARSPSHRSRRRARARRSESAPSLRGRTCSRASDSAEGPSSFSTASV